MRQSSTRAEDLLPLVGSTPLIPSLYRFLRNSSTGNLPLDLGIFQAILTCIIAGDRNLILLTPEEDVSLVARLAFWTLSTVFDVSAHRLKIKPPAPPASRSRNVPPPADPSVFLRSLFLQPAGKEHVEPSPPPSRNRSGKFRQPLFRPSSVPPSPGVGQVEFRLDVESSGHPSPSRSTSHILSQPELPRALILTGLEDAKITEQRALAEVLTARKVVIHRPKREQAGSQPKFSLPRSQESFDSRDSAGSYGTWNLPDGFIVIYVCPLSKTEHPKILRPLLDNFAMSSTIFVKQNVRQAFKALPLAGGHFRTRLLSLTRSTPPTSPPSSPALSTHAPLVAPRPVSAYHNTNVSNHPPAPAPVVPKLSRSFIASLQRAASRVYFSSGLSLYMADLFAAARHHPQLDGTLLTAQAMDDAQALAGAWRVLGADPTGAELIRDGGAGQILGSGEFPEVEDEEDEGHVPIIVTVPTPRVSRIEDGRENRPRSEAVLSASEADVARVVPRVITHRVRVRDGPADEILGSAVIGATGRKTMMFGAGDSMVEVGVANEGKVGWDTRSTIKDILVRILAEV